jgi:hypothetical protein
MTLAGVSSLVTGPIEVKEKVLRGKISRSAARC